MKKRPEKKTERRAERSPYFPPWEDIVGHSQAVYILMDKKGERVLLSTPEGRELVKKGEGESAGLSETHLETIRRLEELHGIPCFRMVRSGTRYYRLRYSYLKEYLFIEGMDVTELYLDSRHDPLTGLPNRGFFYEVLENTVSQAKREKKLIAVYVMDISRFKALNDTYGHAFGDRFLVEVARRLKRSVRGYDLVARAGSDEFYALGTSVDSPEQAVGFAERILRSFETPLLVFGQRKKAELSIGICAGPDEGRVVYSDDFIRYADVAMVHAKKKGQSYALFATGN